MSSAFPDFPYPVDDGTFVGHLQSFVYAYALLHNLMTLFVCHLNCVCVCVCVCTSLYLIYNRTNRRLDSRTHTPMVVVASP
jgi:hypothetical protein